MTRRALPAMWRAAGITIAATVLLAVFYAATPAHADPNVESTLPADGVVSVTRSGDTWTITTVSPASEIKVISNPQQIVCGTNYGNPCEVSESFTWTADCVFLQVDGIAGNNSSDPYICHPAVVTTPPTSPPPVEPTATPSPTATPTATPEPTTSPSVAPTSTPAEPDNNCATECDELAATGVDPLRALVVAALLALTAVVLMGVRTMRYTPQYRREGEK